jgi:hypothetical protein
VGALLVLGAIVVVVRTSKPDAAGVETPATTTVPGPAGYRLVPPLQPANLPPGWVLERATTVLVPGAPAQCEQLELDYGLPGTDAGYMFMFQLPADCVDPAPLAGSVPFRAGEREGTVVAGTGATTRARLVVGPAVVEAQSDLGPDALAGVLAVLEPFRP